MDARRHRVDRVLEAMTLAEKVGQMAQVELNSIGPNDVAAWAVGSVLSGGGGNPGDGSAAAWRTHVEALVEASTSSRLGVPILYGADAVHGHSNVRGATIFPHNLGLGAAGDAGLVERVARASALETAATGVRWSFAPCLAVTQDVRWGRTYEAFSSDPTIVTELGAASIRGWHGERVALDGVLACAKHFVGEGSMVWGSAGAHRHQWIDWWDGWGAGWQIDQGDITLDEAELRRLHFPPFVAAIEAGVRTVMVSYASWHGERLHGHRRLLTDVLKGELGFTGFVVTDWMGVEQVDAHLPTAIERAINAGVDMVMVPFDYQRFIMSLIESVEAGRVPMDRIDDAVRRILMVKHDVGLLTDPTPTRVPLELVGCDEHRAVAREAVRGSLVALTGADALPVPADTSILAAGQALDDIGISCGGWTISWEGGAGAVTDGATIRDGLERIWGAAGVRYEPEAMSDRRARHGIVTVHELPYVEGGGDRGDLRVPDEQLEIVRRVRERVEVLIVLVVSGRPLLIEPIVDMADAVIACWLPGSESDAVADALGGSVALTGRLPVPWPRHPAHLSGSHAAGPDPWPRGHGGQELTLAGGR